MVKTYLQEIDFSNMTNKEFISKYQKLEKALDIKFDADVIETYNELLEQYEAELSKRYMNGEITEDELNTEESE